MMKITETSIRQACNHLAETLINKNQDYGNSVEEQFNEYGELSLGIRLDDKLRRFKQLTQNQANVKTESKADTLLDAAGYSILGHILLSSLDGEARPTFTNGLPGQMWSPKTIPEHQVAGFTLPKKAPYFDIDDV